MAAFESALSSEPRGRMVVHFPREKTVADFCRFKMATLPFWEAELENLSIWLPLHSATA
jgi:hypothetical protein